MFLKSGEDFKEDWGIFVDGLALNGRPMFLLFIELGIF